MGRPHTTIGEARFTSEFEMGSGGSNSLWPPGKLGSDYHNLQNTVSYLTILSQPKLLGVLYGQASRAISTG